MADDDRVLVIEVRITHTMANVLQEMLDHDPTVIDALIARNLTDHMFQHVERAYIGDLSA